METEPEASRSGLTGTTSQMETDLVWPCLAAASQPSLSTIASSRAATSRSGSSNRRISSRSTQTSESQPPKSRSQIWKVILIFLYPNPPYHLPPISPQKTFSTVRNRGVPMLTSVRPSRVFTLPGPFLFLASEITKEGNSHERQRIRGANERQSR